MLKSKYAPNEVHTFNSLLQYYDGEADMPGGLSRADYNADRWQSTRPYDRFWGDASSPASATSSSRMPA
jgi:Fe(3+) dicitrate transport protein